MKDYHNIIVDTYRCQCNMSYDIEKKYPQKYSEEYWEETRRPMKERTTKHFNDRLKPLERFLDKNIGKKWDNVYSELCNIADKRSIRGFHLHQHVKEYVSIGEEPERLYGIKSKYYVDDNGLLRKRTNKERGFRADTKKERFELDAVFRERKNENKIEINEDTYLLKRYGHWYIFIKKSSSYQNDRFYNEGIYFHYYQKKKKLGLEKDALSYEQMFEWDHKQLSKKELRYYGLENDKI